MITFKEFGEKLEEFSFLFGSKESERKASTVGLLRKERIMIDLERAKRNFRNHVATFTDYGNIKMLDFKRPDSNEYRIRFLFEEDYCRLHISGDLGALIATNFMNMTYEKKIAIAAMRKQIPEKPVTYKETNRADCPVCGETVRGIDKPYGKYCSGCGQKLDWSEIDE